MSDYFGIDFGTTNSAIVTIPTINGKRVGGEPIRIGEDENHPLPSFVAIHKVTGEVRTGKDARDTITDAGEYRVFPSIKSAIDKDESYEIAGKTWTPVDIAGELFKALKQKVIDKSSNMDIKEAVVAVPVGFSSKKKHNVRMAAKKAGIDVKMFISEPTAAYCSRLNEMKNFRNVAVFDWGGGTLDVVVLQIEKNNITELSSGGLQIAGNDIDEILARKVCSKVSKNSDQNFSFDDLKPETKLSLLSRCEDAKCWLSDDDVAKIILPRLDDYGRVMEKIDYEYFELLIENQVDQAVECLLEALSDAGMNRESIDCIICEGGSSRLRPLQNRMLEYFDRDKLLFPKTAMWDIALGAAEISEKPGCYKLSKPVGIIQSNNEFKPLLPEGQRIPSEEKNISFGITETSSEARFVFSDGDESNQTFTEYFPVKLRGFSDEIVKASCYVDEDMIFKIKIYSNRMPEDVFRVWSYSNLKVSYEIEAPDPQWR